MEEKREEQSSRKHEAGPPLLNCLAPRQFRRAAPCAKGFEPCRPHRGVGCRYDTSRQRGRQLPLRTRILQQRRLRQTATCCYLAIPSIPYFCSGDSVSPSASSSSLRTLHRFFIC